MNLSLTRELCHALTAWNATVVTDRLPVVEHEQTFTNVGTHEHYHILMLLLL